MSRIAPASLPTDLPALTQLFRAYAASLPIDLGYQGFDGELASLPGKYAAPAGALLIARDANGAPIGCVAMRPLEERVCEMKRLYVAPEGRGLGLGKALRILRIVARMARESAEGQAVELAWVRDGRWDQTPVHYMRMVHKKTSYYSFITPLLVGGVAAGASDPALHALFVLGARMGPALGLGKALTLALIEAARAAGYREIRLDTLPTMANAQTLYRALGFTEIAPYSEGAPDGTLFMSITL